MRIGWDHPAVQEQDGAPGATRRLSGVAIKEVASTRDLRDVPGRHGRARAVERCVARDPEPDNRPGLTGEQGRRPSSLERGDQERPAAEADT